MQKKLSHCAPANKIITSLPGFVLRQLRVSSYLCPNCSETDTACFQREGERKRERESERERERERGWCPPCLRGYWESTMWQFMSSDTRAPCKCTNNLSLSVSRSLSLCSCMNENHLDKLMAAEEVRHDERR